MLRTTSLLTKAKTSPIKQGGLRNQIVLAFSFSSWYNEHKVVSRLINFNRRKRKIMKKLVSNLSVLLIIILVLTLSACGKDGITPIIEINEDGYWVINGEITNVKATSEDVVDENPQGLDFYKKDDGTYVVSVGLAKYHSNIVIPEMYKGSKVVALDDYAFRQCTHISSVIIPNSVTSIGEMAFAHCYALNSVIIPDSVTTIADMAFTSCTNLSDVYYTGSEDEWASIIIGSMNNELINATIHYNYVSEE